MSNPSQHRARVWFWRVIIHTFGVGTTSALTAMTAFDLSRVQMLWASYGAGLTPDYTALFFHVALSACAWALIVIAFMWANVRRANARKIVRVSRGTAMTEFLIILVPFLLLTSGLAQLAMLNVTGMLADLAVFQAARVAWVWQPEVDAGRASVSSVRVRDRARTIASMILAPTAPNDYLVGRMSPPGSTNDYRRARAVNTAAFMPNFTNGTIAYEFSGGASALLAGGAFGLDVEEASPENLSFYRAFDESSFKHRAARKMTFAEWGLWDEFEVLTGDRTGVEFTYRYNIIFPWFGYIWGQPNEIGMRSGYYSPIHRRHTFKSQRSMR